ncbi:hypothetical protein GBK02_02965 [Dechloromonas sp. TW-R-39-2]|jgi:hypothetical protein|uniref:hypothetical protein n=1 Tax=Dechloromonas sp. TW-R-39-2 TaxID=2654218 RepID=UPI00193DBC51|nr:hypothetical protein [Dechloromonas sp. TW-R-39-2]QRM18433.1 hypothetical protein GBK02_02965 [Dechloromonas sp. TW-R-39-2]
MPDYRAALATRSSYVENVLTHSMIAALAGELWRRDPEVRMDILRTEVDESGFDLVLTMSGRTRFVQIKQVNSEGKNKSFSVRTDFTLMPGSCVVVIVHRDFDLAIEGYRYFGATPNDPMPSVDGFNSSVLPGRRDKEGNKKVREHYRDIPGPRFRKLPSVSDLLDALFPNAASQPAEASQVTAPALAG